MSTANLWRTGLFGAALCLALASMCQAVSFTWNFNIPADNVGSSTFIYPDTTNFVNITAHGFDATNAIGTGVTTGQTWGPGAGFTFDSGAISDRNLFGKNEGVDEIGLGLFGGSIDNEMDGDSFLQLDLQDLFDKGLTNMNMTISSIQPGEGFYLWGSNTLGTPGQLIDLGVNPPDPATHTFAVPDYGLFRYVSISSDGTGDVVLQNGASADVIPEPLTLTGLLLGLGGLVRYASRRKVA